MGSLDGRVVLVTGAGSGLGRAHADRLAAEGALVGVNDVDEAAVDAVCAGIRGAGGVAEPLAGDVSDWETARGLVDACVERFGSLHVLVNNAGNLRERIIPLMAEEEWDDVIRVHLKGHFAMLRWASAYWRDRHKSGGGLDASVVNTTSNSGLLGQPTQASYGAAKAAIASLTVIAAQELRRYGVRVNAVAPAARTAMTDSVPALREAMRAPKSGFDKWHPDNASAVVAYLSRAGLDMTGQCWLVLGGKIQRFAPWALAERAVSDTPWTPDTVAEVLPRLATTTWSEPSNAIL